MVVFVVDDPAVLLVVSSSFACWTFLESSCLEGGGMLTMPSFLEITAIITTAVAAAAAVSPPLVLVLVAATLSLASSRTSRIFEFLPFQAFGGGSAGDTLFVCIFSDAVLVMFVSLFEPERFVSCCVGVGAASDSGESDLAPSMLSLRPFHAIVCSNSELRLMYSIRQMLMVEALRVESHQRNDVKSQDFDLVLHSATPSK